jgi:hypothetical protein
LSGEFIPQEYFAVETRFSNGISYINPDALDLVAVSSCLGFRLELGSNKGQHVFATAKKDLASGIIGPGLLLVEALESVLLGSLGIALMGFDEARIEKEEKRADNARRIIVLPGASRGNQTGNAKAT